MGYQVIKQPTGQLFAIFSTFTDTIIVYDASAAEVVDWFAERASRDARTAVARLVQLVDADKAREAYYQFTMTWDEALREDEQHGGEAWQQPWFQANGQ
jgi:ERCC4-related helicase